jgi:act minimal PKS acyl carrier protein
MSNKVVELSDLRRILRESAGTEQGVDLGGDILDTSFDDLGYDSIAVMETTSRIAREYGVTVDDEALFEARTPRLLLGLVNPA